MADVPKTTLATSQDIDTFPPMYYDSPIEQVVLALSWPSDDTLTASITAGAPYYTIKTLM
jgi:hypothetical protein